MACRSVRLSGFFASICFRQLSASVGEQVGESGGCNSDHFVAPAIEGDTLANDVRISVEPMLSQLITQDPAVTCLIFFWQKVPAKNRLHPEQR